MEVERQEPCGGRDMASLDLDLLQLPELSPFALRERPSLPEALYRQWLSLPETSKSVRVVLLSFFFLSISGEDGPWIRSVVEKLGYKSLLLVSKRRIQLNCFNQLKSSLEVYAS